MKYPLAHLQFLAFFAVALLLSFRPLYDLITPAGRSDYYSHILLIPFVSGYLIWSRRKEIFARPEKSTGAGFLLVLAGSLVYSLGVMYREALSRNDYASIVTFAAVVFLAGAWELSYGRAALRRAAFPLLFLLFAVPVPDYPMQHFIQFLQRGSAEAVDLLFRLTGVSFFREGMLFQLPAVTIEVAGECSGIRSTLALFIVGILAGHLFLDGTGRRAIFILAIFPIVILKNAVRILTLTLLAVHVSPRFLTGGFLHTSGGFLFFIPALALLGWILYFLRGKTDFRIKAEP